MTRRGSSRYLVSSTPCVWHAAGLLVGVVSNQSGVARQLISPEQLRRANARVCELLGPFDVIVCCPHGEEDGCTCRKPRPGW